MRKLIQLGLLAALLLSLPAIGRAQFNYRFNNNGITITGYFGSGGAVTVPGVINGYAVTAIGDAAFAYAGITSILIADSVTSIGNKAFNNCQSLTNVTVGNSVNNIGGSVFASCPRMMSVCFRGNAPALGGGNVFSGNFAKVYYLPGTFGWSGLFGSRPTVLWNPPVPFNYTTNNGTITITGYTGSDVAITVPNSINFLPIVAIGDSAFNIYDLTSLTIANGVNSIGNWVCYGCPNLVNVSIPNSVTNIGEEAFSGCSSLTNVVIPNKITLIEFSLFADCASLTNIVVPNDVSIIGDSAFARCFGLRSIVIPGSVTNIGNSAFFECLNLTSITIPTNVAFLNGEIFQDCGSLTNITIPDSVTSIGDEAFAGCTGLSTISVPNSVTNMAGYVFIGCTGLTNVTIGSNVASIGNDSFTDCTNLLGIMVAPSNSFFCSIAGVLFNHDQTALIQYPAGKVGGYIIPNTVTNIEYEAFLACAGLTNLTIPASVNTLGSLAFENCSSLINVTIPGSIASIGDDAFDSCTNLKSATILNGVTGIGDFAFNGCASLTNVTLPDTLTNLGDAFDYCTSLRSVVIPGSVSAISEFAFAGCTQLTAAFFAGNAPGDAYDIFYGDSNVTVYYLPGTVGWSNFTNSNVGVPIAVWLPEIQPTSAGTGGQINPSSFTINWASGQTVAVDACTNLANPVWQPLQTNTLTTGSAYFSDPQWTNHPSRFYRLRSL